MEPARGVLPRGGQLQPLHQDQGRTALAAQGDRRAAGSKTSRREGEANIMNVIFIFIFIIMTEAEL